MIRDEYFEWLVSLVCKYDRPQFASFDKLLFHLDTVDFKWTIPIDENRAMDGVDLRWRYVVENHFEDEYGDYVLSELNGPCTMLEMMIALALRCEENIMDDPAIGNRTGQWFWMMVVNLGLGSMTDRYYDKRYVNDVLNRFFDCRYEPDGKGGLFHVRNCPYDLRNHEIWHQLNCYINSIM